MIVWRIRVKIMTGMGSSRTGLDLEDSSRTKFCGLGLGLGLEDPWPWPWPRSSLALALALASTMRGLDFGFEIWP